MNFVRNMFQGAASRVRNIDPKDVLSRAAQIRIIDVREPSEFAGELGHIARAELVPLGTLPDAARGWPHDAEIVAVCRSGARSGRAAQILTDLRFQRVENLWGGMTAWNAAGLPVVLGP